MSRCPIPPALDRGVFGWDAVKLYENYSAQELAQAICQIDEDPANANPAHKNGGSIYLTTAAARKRTSALAYAVFYHQQDRREVKA